VAHICNPSYLEAEIEGSQFEDSPDKTPSQPKKAGCGAVHLSSQLHGIINRRNMVQASLGINRETLKKYLTQNGLEA
jgi:hypothetical protein